MAIISGSNAHIFVGSIDAGIVDWQEIAGDLTPVASGFTVDDELPIAKPQDATLELDFIIDPEALPFVTDLCLQSYLGPNYKN